MSNSGYLNGDILLRFGKISKTPTGQVTEKAPKIASFVPQNEYFTLSIQVSNYTNLHGGLEKPLKIGPLRPLTDSLCCKC